MIFGASERCCKRRFVCGNDNYGESRGVSIHWPKRCDHFLEWLMFQVGGVAVYQDPEKLQVFWIQGLSHCRREFDLEE